MSGLVFLVIGDCGSFLCLVAGVQRLTFPLDYSLYVFNQCFDLILGGVEFLPDLLDTLFLFELPPDVFFVFSVVEVVFPGFDGLEFLFVDVVTVFE